MLVLPEDVQVLRRYIANIEDLIATDDVQLVLDTINDEIIDNILANHDEPDAEGIKLQLIYDRIDMRNE